MDLFVGDVSAFGRVKIFFRSGKLRDGCMWRRAEKELRAGGAREDWGGPGGARECSREASRGLGTSQAFFLGFWT